MAKCVGCGGGIGRVRESIGERCGKVCWHVGEVKRDGGCGKVLGEM